MNRDRAIKVIGFHGMLVLQCVMACIITWRVHTPKATDSRLHVSCIIVDLTIKLCLHAGKERERQRQAID